MAALPPGSSFATERRQRGQGTNLGFGYVGDDVQWDIGTTGVGFPVTNVVGGLSKTGDLGRYSYKLEAYRRPITGSLLSYAGARDPITGQVWGGVVATGAAGRLSTDIGPYSTSLSLSLAALTGKNVATNTRAQLRWALDRDVWRHSDGVVNLGVAVSAWHYGKDLSEFSFGHGGYYSPRNYVSVALPLEWSGRRGALTWLARGSVSVSRSSSADSDYFPQSALLQALARARLAADGGVPVYAGSSGSGFGRSFRGHWNTRSHPISHWVHSWSWIARPTTRPPISWCMAATALSPGTLHWTTAHGRCRPIPASDMSSAASSSRKSPPATSVLHALAQRLWPSLGTASAIQRPTSIGIAGLPDGIGQLPSHVPVSLVAADSRSAAAWFPALIEDALAAGPLGLVASSTQWLDELLEYPELRAAYRAGRLKLWALSPGLQAQVQRHGLSPLVQELERTGLLPQHALYLCDTQNLLSGLNIAQLAHVSDQLSALCRQRQRPVVLGFTPPLDATALLPTLRNLCQMSMHIATLHADADRWRLSLDRWGSDTGALFQTGFGLVQDASTHRLTADGTRTQGATPELVTAADQWGVLATRASVEGQRGIPGHWRIVDGLEDIEVAAATCVASTVLIDAGSAGDFESRARLVHHLRLSRPPTLKIVVRENLGKLRTHSEQALLQLGASAVVYKEVGFSRLLQLLQDINAQSHTRKVHPDYAQALDSFMPPASGATRPRDDSVRWYAACSTAPMTLACRTVWYGSTCWTGCRTSMLCAPATPRAMATCSRPTTKRSTCSCSPAGSPM